MLPLVVLLMHTLASTPLVSSSFWNCATLKPYFLRKSIVWLLRYPVLSSAFIVSHQYMSNILRHLTSHSSISETVASPRRNRTLVKRNAIGAISPSRAPPSPVYALVCVDHESNLSHLDISKDRKKSSFFDSIMTFRKSPRGSFPTSTEVCTDQQNHLFRSNLAIVLPQLAWSRVTVRSSKNYSVFALHCSRVLPPRPFFIYLLILSTEAPCDRVVSKKKLSFPGDFYVTQGHICHSVSSKHTSSAKNYAKFTTPFEKIIGISSQLEDRKMTINFEKKAGYIIIFLLLTLC